MHLLLVLAETLWAVLTLVLLWSKHVIAYQHCPGNIPLLDYVVSVPLLFGGNAMLIRFLTGWNVPVDAIAFGSLLLVSITLYIAWKLGDGRNSTDGG